jgi:hypothetical protein
MAGSSTRIRSTMHTYSSKAMLRFPLMSISLMIARSRLVVT